MSDEEGVVAIVQGLKDAGLAVTVLNRRLLRSRNRNENCKAYRRPLASKSSVETNTDKSYSNYYTVNKGTSVRDGHYASSYQIDHCNARPTSPPATSPGFPPQRVKPSRTDGNFEVGGNYVWEALPSPPRSYGGGMGYSERTVDSGPMYTNRAERLAHEKFAHSLRRYPACSPERSISSELVQKLLSYTQNKYSTKSSSKSQRSLNRDISPRGSKFESKPSKNIQTYTRTKHEVITKDCGANTSHDLKFIPKNGRNYSTYKNKRYKNDNNSTSYNYLDSPTSRHSARRTNEVRYIRDVKKFIHDTIRQMYEDKPTVCPKMRSRYSHHRRQHHKGPHDQTNSIEIQASAPTTSSYCVPPPGSHSYVPYYVSTSTSDIICCNCNKPRPCICEQRAATAAAAVQKHITDWVDDLPMLNENTRENKREKEQIIQELGALINTVPKDENYDENVKEVIKYYIESLPMWDLGDNEDDHKYKNEVIESLTDRLQSLEDKTAAAVKDLVRKWLNGIQLDSNIDINKIVNTFTSHLTPLLDDIHALETELNELLESLPITKKENVIKGIRNDLLNDLIELSARSGAPVLTEGELENTVNEFLQDYQDILNEIEKVKNLRRKLKNIQSEPISEGEKAEKMKDNVIDWIDTLSKSTRDKFTSKEKEEFSNDLVDKIQDAANLKAMGKERKSSLQTLKEIENEIWDLLENMDVDRNDIDESIVKEYALNLKEMKKSGFDEDVANKTIDFLNELDKSGVPMSVRDQDKFQEKVLSKLKIIQAKDRRFSGGKQSRFVTSTPRKGGASSGRDFEREQELENAVNEFLQDHQDILNEIEKVKNLTRKLKNIQSKPISEREKEEKMKDNVVDWIDTLSKSTRDKFTPREKEEFSNDLVDKIQGAANLKAMGKERKSSLQTLKEIENEIWDLLENMDVDRNDIDESIVKEYALNLKEMKKSGFDEDVANKTIDFLNELDKSGVPMSVRDQDEFQEKVLSKLKRIQAKDRRFSGGKQSRFVTSTPRKGGASSGRDFEREKELENVVNEFLQDHQDILNEIEKVKNLTRKLKNIQSKPISEREKEEKMKDNVVDWIDTLSKSTRDKFTPREKEEFSNDLVDKIQGAANLKAIGKERKSSLQTLKEIENEIWGLLENMDVDRNDIDESTVKEYALNLKEMKKTGFDEDVTNKTIDFLNELDKSGVPMSVRDQDEFQEKVLSKLKRIQAKDRQSSGGKRSSFVTSTPRKGGAPSGRDFNVSSIGKDDESGYSIAGPSGLKTAEKQYINELDDQIEPWVETLPINLDREKKPKQAMINDLANDIMDRQKYLQIHPNAIKSDADELEHLKYQVFRWLNKMDGVKDHEIAPVMDKTNDLMDKIKNIDVPQFNKSSLRSPSREEKFGSPTRQKRLGSPIREQSLGSSTEEKTFSNKTSIPKQDPSMFIKENLDGAITDWIKQLPLYETASPEEKRKFEDVAQEISKAIKRVYDSIDNLEQDIDKLVTDEIEKQMKDSPLNTEDKNDKTFMTQAAAQLLQYLKDQQMFQDISERTEVPYDKYIKQAVDNWAKSLSLSQLSSPEKLNFDDLKDDFTTKLKQAREDKVDKDTLKSEINDFLKEFPLKDTVRRNKEYQDRKVEELIKALSTLPVAIASRKIPNFHHAVRQAITKWMQKLPLDKGKNVTDIRKGAVENMANKVSEALTLSDEIPKVKESVENATKRFLDEVPLDPKKTHDAKELADDLFEQIKDIPKDSMKKGTPIPNGVGSSKRYSREDEPITSNELKAVGDNLSGAILDWLKQQPNYADKKVELDKLAPELSKSIKSILQQSKEEDRDKVLIDELTKQFKNTPLESGNIAQLVQYLKDLQMLQELPGTTMQKSPEDLEKVVTSFVNNNLNLKKGTWSDKEKFGKLKSEFVTKLKEMIDNNADRDTLKKEIKYFLSRFPLSEEEQRDERFLEKKAEEIIESLPINDSNSPDVYSYVRKGFVKWMKNLPLERGKNINDIPKEAIGQITKRLSDQLIHTEACSLGETRKMIEEETNKFLQKIPLDGNKSYDAKKLAKDLFDCIKGRSTDKSQTASKDKPEATSVATSTEVSVLTSPSKDKTTEIHPKSLPKDKTNKGTVPILSSDDSTTMVPTPKSLPKDKTTKGTIPISSPDDSTTRVPTPKSLTKDKTTKGTIPISSPDDSTTRVPTPKSLTKDKTTKGTIPISSPDDSSTRVPTPKSLTKDKTTKGTVPISSSPNDNTTMVPTPKSLLKDKTTKGTVPIPSSKDNTSMVPTPKSLPKDKITKGTVPVSIETILSNKSGSMHPSFKSAADQLADNIEQWVNNLPIKEDTLEEKSKASDLRRYLSSRIISKVSELNANPEIFNDDFLYEEMFEDDVDSMITALSSEDLRGKTLAHKTTLIDIVKEARRKAQEEMAGTVYRQQLREVVSKNVPSESLNEKENATLEVLKEDVADAFVSLHYIRGVKGDNESKTQFKNNVKSEIDVFCSDYLKSHPKTAVDTEKLNNDLYKALKDIPAPNDETMRNEIEIIKIKEVINQWIDEGKLFGKQAGVDRLKTKKKISVLAKKIHDIEKLKENNPDFDPDDMLKKEIQKWLQKMPLVVKDDLDKLAEQLIKKLKETEAWRKSLESDSSGKESTLPASSYSNATGSSPLDSTSPLGGSSRLPATSYSQGTGPSPTDLNSPPKSSSRPRFSTTPKSTVSPINNLRRSITSPSRVYCTCPEGPVTPVRIPETTDVFTVPEDSGPTTTETSTAPEYTIVPSPCAPPCAIPPSTLSPEDREYLRKIRERATQSMAQSSPRSSKDAAVSPIPVEYGSQTEITADITNATPQAQSSPRQTFEPVEASKPRMQAAGSQVEVVPHVIVKEYYWDSVDSKMSPCSKIIPCTTPFQPRPQISEFTCPPRPCPVRTSQHAQTTPAICPEQCDLDCQEYPYFLPDLPKPCTTKRKSSYNVGSKIKGSNRNLTWSKEEVYGDRRDLSDEEEILGTGRRKQLGCRCKDRVTVTSYGMKKADCKSCRASNDETLRRCPKCCGVHCPFPSYLYFKQ